jgi:DSF synthase
MSELMVSKVHDTHDFGLREEVAAKALRPSKVKAFYDAVTEKAPLNEGVPPFDLEWWLRTTPFREVEVEYDMTTKVVWQFMKFRRRPSVTLELLREIKQILEMIGKAFDQPGAQDNPPVNYVVLASKLPGVFNMGGDLPLFVDLIRSGDAEGLRHYAHACVDVQYLRWSKQRLPIQTVSLVQGDALGGGFEAALADDIIIAEESAKFALPEILFNLFPGMGAYSFLARRLNAATAERLMLSGKIYTAGELYELGIVDRVVPDGKGVEGFYGFVSDNERSYAARRAILDARRTVNPLDPAELTEITDRWVDAALTLAPLDLRKMERLAKAQDRRRGRAREVA